MILNLDERQSADRERLGACVVPGESIPGECPFHTYARPGCWTCKDFRPPRQFSDAAAPCQTCGGKGVLSSDGVKTKWRVAGHATMPCRDCRDGKPIIEIRVPCPHIVVGPGGQVEGRAFPPVAEPPGTCDWGHCERTSTDWRWSDHPDVRGWLPVCRTHASQDSGFVVVARATVTLLPVVDVASLPNREWPKEPSAVVIEPPGWHHSRVWMPDEAGVYRSTWDLFRGRFDPLPVAGRDWVAVFEDAT